MTGLSRIIDTPAGAPRHRPIEFGVPDTRADQVMVPMRDGVRLATDIFLPRSATPVPTILVRLPYDKSSAFAAMSEVASRMTDRGYAFVVQDVRGKVRSEGETLAFVHEVPDGHDTLDWIASQTWSNGHVGMFGDSYYGFTQWAALASEHPALRAMVPRNTTSEIGTDWMYLDGVFNVSTMVEWAIHTWVANPLMEHDIDWEIRPLQSVAPTTVGGQRIPSLDAWAEHGPDDPYWTAAVYAGKRPEAGRIPALHVGGFYDVFSRGQLRDFQRSLKGSAPNDQFLVMDASDHFDDVLTRSGTTPDYDATLETLKAFLDTQYLAGPLEFFDRYLMGRDAAIPRVRWKLGAAGWREATAWPPPGAVELLLYPADAVHAGAGPQGGGLAGAPDAVGGVVSWVHDPADPVPSLVEDAWRPLLRLPDERPVQMRDDVVCFTTDPQPAPLDLAGPVRFVASFSASRDTTHLVARLLDVTPSGESRLIIEGACLVRGALDGTTAVVDLGDTGYSVEPGHRLRLAVSSSCYPRWAVHPGTDESPFSAERLLPTTVRLHLNRDQTRLSLTVLPNGA